jgi:iron-sulfur cluster assembly protein
MLTLTETAANKIKDNIARRGHGLGIRIGVKTTGCSGLAYTLEYLDHIDETLAIFESQVVYVYMDPKHMPYLTGIEMTWQRKGLNEGFEFSNPNSKGECGCGESFRV